MISRNFGTSEHFFTVNDQRKTDKSFLFQLVNNLVQKFRLTEEYLRTDFDDLVSLGIK